MMKTLRRGTTTLGGVVLLAALTSAGSLRFTPSSQYDVSSLNLTSVGDLTFDRTSAQLWISEGSIGGMVYRLNPGNGALLGQVNTSVVPGLTGGPDAFAVLGSPSDVCVFSSLGESAAGRVSQAGALVANFGSALGVTGAVFDSSGHLFAVAGTAPGGGSTLLNLNPSTGAILGSQVVQNTSRMVDVAQDPHTGLYYGLTEDTNELVQISTFDGHIVSSTDMTPFLVQTNTIHGGVAFDFTGARLFVATGSGAAADVIVVLNRNFSTVICDGANAAVPCPCGNQGLPNHGCDNSLGNGGVLLDASGRPAVSSDSLVLTAAGLPASATGLFFQGTSAIGPAQLFGDGLRCVGGTVIRLGTKTSSAGGMTYPGAGDASIHVRGLVSVGNTERFYQLWYRNSASFCTSATFNLSNALQAHWAP